MSKKLLQKLQRSYSSYMQTALERCKAFALDWVEAAETPIPSLNSTGGQFHLLAKMFQSESAFLKLGSL